MRRLIWPRLAALFTAIISLVEAAAEPGAAPGARPASPHFTRWHETAALHGVHEVFLVRDYTPDRPFDLEVQVTFTPSSGAANAKTVEAFYDGGNVWRARVYVSETGRWTWSSRCAADAKLDGKQGTFEAVKTSLRGRLLPHPRNPSQWITENGKWFLNLNDTAYLLFLDRDGLGQEVSFADFQHYVRDVSVMGLTSIRSMMACAYNSPQTVFFESNRVESLDLERFQRTDSRLQWMLDHYPDVYVQLIVLPLPQGWGKDDQGWHALPVEARQRLLRHVVARFAAFPQIFWLVTNDAHYGPEFPNNNAQAHEVGQFLLAHDPWNHPRSTGAHRGREFPFPEEPWATYLHLERSYDLNADGLEPHRRWNKPVFNGEDRYESDHAESYDPFDMRYFQRRLFWSWLLAGGSANYGGRFCVVHPYSETGSRAAFFRYARVTHFRRLTGLDSAPFIRPFFESRGIDLGDFTPDNALVRDAGVSNTVAAPKLMPRGFDEFLVYHPNAAANGQAARAAPDRPARLTIDLTQARGSFLAEWYRPHDGVVATARKVRGGAVSAFTAPWPEGDVVLRLYRAGNTNAHP